MAVSKVSPGARIDAGTAARELLSYCRANDWAGFDPYDGLNSRVFKVLPLRRSRLARLAWIQAIKRSPINLRPLLGVPKTANPKGVALFLAAVIRLSRGGLPEAAGLIEPLADKLLALRSPGRPRFGWGYNFDWQQRSALVPKGSPNIVCTTFAGHALLDGWEKMPVPAWKEAASSAAAFIREELFARNGSSPAWFRYTLAGREEIHNANLLGAAYLCRVGRAFGQASFFGPALEAARTSVSKQRADGSWAYGEASTQGWIDSFHTGFNLVALRAIGRNAGTSEFEPALRKGFEFFRTRFFREDGAPKYYPDRVYPIDIHSAAQAVITLVELADLSPDAAGLAASVLDWTLSHMRDRSGYFYYQKRPRGTVRTPFMRWSQAWMLLALATYLDPDGGKTGVRP